MMRIERSWIQARSIRLPAEATKTATARTVILCDRAKKIVDAVCAQGFAPRSGVSQIKLAMLYGGRFEIRPICGMSMTHKADRSAKG